MNSDNQKNNKPPKPQKPPKNAQVKRAINLRFMLIIWFTVFGLLLIAFFATYYIEAFELQQSIALVAALMSFAAFVVQSVFSFSILNYNAINRQTNEELRAFQTMQFLAANYTVIDFVDHMLLFDESVRYIERLHKTGDFRFYLKQDDIDAKNIQDTVDAYKFLTVKIPISLVEGKAIGEIRFSSFTFASFEGTEYHFIPCLNQSSSLILYNETDHRNEVVVNLITKKDSDFYTSCALNPFAKIKIRLTMQSLLGVAVHGAIELYFTNPEKLEKSGANRYKIVSSHFEIEGAPELAAKKGE
ncbi:MAG: hypothetical protein FWH03_06560 [Firmicutes bacterium]|nr:hypothetical protein [Bacillota bacterium]